MAANLFSKTPMRAGWNTQRYHEPIKKQVICYMQNIRLPPTRKDVVKKTLKRSEAVAKECGDKYAIVTYSLAVAKITRQIQIQNSPKFDDCFIRFVQFHTLLSLFSSISKILEESGATYLLSEAKIIAGGSINKFLKEKSLNRCRRGNLLVATAMHSLHLERFIEDMNIPSTNLLQEHKNWAIVEDMSEVHSNLQDMLTKYDSYLEETLNGKMGKLHNFE